MKRLRTINPESTWAQMNWFERRINSFFAYTISAVLSLFIPDIVDNAVCNVLNRQFLD